MNSTEKTSSWRCALSSARFNAASNAMRFGRPVRLSQCASSCRRWLAASSSRCVARSAVRSVKMPTSTLAPSSSTNIVLVVRMVRIEPSAWVCSSSLMFGRPVSNTSRSIALKMAACWALNSSASVLPMNRSRAMPVNSHSAWFTSRKRRLRSFTRIGSATESMMLFRNKVSRIAVPWRITDASRLTRGTVLRSASALAAFVGCLGSTRGPSSMGCRLRSHGAALGAAPFAAISTGHRES